MDDRAHLQALLVALDATPRALRRDDCGDWSIRGKAGHILANGHSFLLFVATQESPRRWTNIKARLRCCRVTLDGDDEGCLHLDRLPTPEEAGAIREALAIKRRRHLSPEAITTLSARLSQSRTGRPSNAPAFAGNVEGHPI